MSARVAYFERTDRGVRPVGVRLVGDRTDETHHCREGEPIAALNEAAAWIREHLPRNGGGGRALLNVLCVDIDGALCSWLTAPSGEARVIGTLARQGATDWGADGDEGESGSARAPAVLAAYAGVPGEASLQALGAPADAKAHAPRKQGKGAPAQVESKLRVPVLAVPDSAARVLVDCLDAEGVRVDVVCSLWHAMSAAWDPAGPASAGVVRGAGSRPAEVVAESTVVSASILVEPAGRLLWAWSRAGGLIAAGSMRLRIERTADGAPGLVRVRRADTARLAAEWMAWSAQLAMAPSRLTCVTPELWAGEDAGDGALDAAGLGVALGRALPGATVDLAVDSDPVGTTLRRVAAGAEASAEAGAIDASSRVEGSTSLVDLSRRPGQSHFRLHLWAALAIAMGAAGVGALAWKFRAEAAGYREAARRTATQARDLFQGANLGPAYPGKELETVMSKVATLEQATKPIKATEAAMPVLAELETLSLVLGIPDIEIESIALDSRLSNRIIVTVPTLEEGEALLGALRSVSGSRLSDWSANCAPPGANGKSKCTCSASWSAEARKPGAEGTP